MAVSGGTTTSYRLTPSASDKPNIERTTWMRSDCTPPAVAVNVLRNWTPDSKVIVQGSDMAQFWALWGGVY